MTPIITLTTDFGLNDEYVGVMKGVLLSRCPACRIVDLSHGIRPYDIRGAARLLAASYSYFPAGTIHLVVVDPGVGGPRRILLGHGDDQMFLGPDNGVLAIFAELLGDSSWYEVRRPDLYLESVSATFHGRDIMAPVAAALASGMAPAEVGPELSPASICRNSLSELKITVGQSTINGRITHIDRFGNIITDIHRQHVSALAAGLGGESHGLRVDGAGFSVRGPAPSYQSVGSRKPLVLYGSRDFLEIAVNGGSAGERFGAEIGDELRVTIINNEN